MSDGHVTTDAARAGRPLGTAERFYWLFDRISCTNFVVVAEFDELPPRAPLIKALDTARRRHPLLGMRIAVDGSGTVCYEPAPETSVSVPVLQGGEPAWTEECLRQLDLRFGEDEFPLLRCQAFPAVSEDTRSAIVFTFHHGVTDAGAATWLVEEVLTDALLGLPVDDTVLPSRPPQEALYPTGFRGLGGWIKRLVVVLSDKLEQWRKGAPRLLPAPAPEPGDARSLVLEKVVIDKERARLLRHRCHKQRTSIHGVLCAAQLQALAGELHGDEAGSEAIGSAIGMRTRVSPPLPDRELGMYVSMVRTRHRLDPSRTTWDLAREVKSELERRVSRGDAHLLWSAFPPAATFPPSDDGARRLAQLLAQEPVPSIVTNIGRVGPEAGTGPIKALHFAMAPQPGCALVTAVCSYRGTLVLNCSFDGAVLDAERAARVAQRIEALLEEISGGA